MYKQRALLLLFARNCCMALVYIENSLCPAVAWLLRLAIAAAWPAGTLGYFFRAASMYERSMLTRGLKAKPTLLKALW